MAPVLNFLLTPESLHELEDNDLDALMADLVADLNATEEKLAAEIEGLKDPSPPPSDLPPPPKGLSTHPAYSLASPTSPASSTGSNVSTPSSSASPLPPPPPQSAKPTKVRQASVQFVTPQKHLCKRLFTSLLGTVPKFKK